MRAYVGLGGNIGDRGLYLQRALELLGAEPGIEVVAVSSVGETDPGGYLEQPPFLNAACAGETSLPAADLLEPPPAVERALGRERTGPRFGPRVIDLDLLLYGDEVVDEPGLSVPHPRLAERRFALEPLAQPAPELPPPG